MDSFGKKSAAYICYLIVNFWWYISCIFGVFLPVFLIYEYAQGTHPDTLFGITIPVSTDLVTLIKPDEYSYLSVEAVKGTVDFGYIMQHNPDTYIIWAVFLCIVIALFLFGLFQLRNLLKSAIHDTVFSTSNIRRIKIIAVLILLLEPLEWVQQHFVFETLPNLVATEAADLSIGLPTPGGDWGFIVVGLLIYALASVFEKGYEMFQELKLTV